MGYIATSKHGNCTRCPGKNTNCKKRGKYLVCLNCCKAEDAGKQMDHAKKREQKNREKGQLRPLLSSYSNVETSSRQNLVNDLDFTVSRIVRKRGSDKDGIQACYTCGFRAHWTKLQCSHYIGRSAIATRFDTRHNCKPGCVGCNIGKHGNLDEFKKRLEADLPGVTESLYQLSKEVTHMSTEELKLLLLALRQELKLIENSLKIKTEL